MCHTYTTTKARARRNCTFFHKYLLAIKQINNNTATNMLFNSVFAIDCGYLKLYFTRAQQEWKILQISQTSELKFCIHEYIIKYFY